MDISPVTALSSPDTVHPTGVLQAVSTPPLSTDTVTISEAGKLLSASALFEAGQNDFAALSVATQYFADAYNSFLQSGILQSAISGALNLPFVEALNANLDISGLSAIGVSLTTGEITIDYQALQAAFIANPSATVSLLAKTALITGQFAAQFTALSAQLNTLGTAATTTSAPAAVNPAPSATPPTSAATAVPTPAATTATTTTTATAPTITVPTTAPTTAPATAVPETPATTAATAIPAVSPAPANAVAPNSADPAVAAAIASYRMTDGSFDMAKPHDRGPAPRTPVYSEIGTIAPVQPVVLNK